MPALMIAAPHLTEADALAAFEVVRSISREDRSFRTAAMGILAGRLPKESRPQAIRQALRALTTSNSINFVRGASGLAPFVSPSCRSRLIERAIGRARSDKSWGGAIYAPLLGIVDQDDREPLTQEALEKTKNASVYSIDGLRPLFFAMDSSARSELFVLVLNKIRTSEEDDGRELGRLPYLLPLPVECDRTLLKALPELIGLVARPTVLLTIASLASTISRTEGSPGVKAILSGLQTVSAELS